MFPPQMDCKKNGLYLNVWLMPCRGAWFEHLLESGFRLASGETTQKLTAARR